MRKRRSKQQAAARRAARERVQRLQHAHRQLQEVKQSREKRKKGDGDNARASTTDPDARKMKMADGGYRPAYNVQVATDLDALVVLEVKATQAVNDSGQMLPMVQQIEKDYAVRPEGYYADGGFAHLNDIEEVSKKGIKIYAPLKEEEEQKKEGKDPSARKKGDGQGVAAWRMRMGTAEGKEKYRLRGKTEWSNAQARNWGLYRVVVRGLAKVQAALSWVALAVNLLRTVALRAAAGRANAVADQPDTAALRAEVA
jgi:hypothetical protein